MRLRQKQNSKAQSISEYVILFGIITAALLGMQVYMKRGIQAVIKVAADEIGLQQDAEEIDPVKGRISNSNINIKVTDATERKRSFEAGRQQIDIDRTSSTKGSSTYISEREE